MALGVSDLAPIERFIYRYPVGKLGKEMVTKSMSEQVVILPRKRVAFQ